MKKTLLIISIGLGLTSFSQTDSTENCIFPKDFIEPKTPKKLSHGKFQLKLLGATTDDLKKHISVENDCNIEDVIMLVISEQPGNGMYSVCVKGKTMKYKRMGSVFMKSDENPFDTK